jgi:hypothetical protein
LVDFMGFELVFGLVRVRELLLEDGVFMGGVLLGFDSMMLVGWAGKFLSTGPARDAAHARNVEGGSFHGGGGEVVCQRRQWRGGGAVQAKFYEKYSSRIFRTPLCKQFSRSGCAQPASAPLPMNLRMQDVCPRMLLA